MPGLDDLSEARFGPAAVELAADRVADFVAVTGDDPDRWSDAVPPFFASTALFSVAPLFLQDERVVPYTRSLIHADQSFTWHRPARIGETVEVTGTVATVRRRGSLELVGFDLEAVSDRGAWLSGTARFVMSREAAAAAEELREPEPEEGTVLDDRHGPFPMPSPGEAIEPLRCGASRLDLVRYAAATRDWNPIHWDHHSAVAAGLPGVIVHGLLMAAWMGRAVSRHVEGEHPLESMAIRFRNPLRPAVEATVTGVVSEREGAPSIEVAMDAAGERLVTANSKVTA